MYVRTVLWLAACVLPVARGFASSLTARYPSATRPSQRSALGSRVAMITLLDTEVEASATAPSTVGEPDAPKRTKRGRRGGSGPGAQRRLAMEAKFASKDGGKAPVAARPAGSAKPTSGISSKPLNLSVGQCVSGTVKTLTSYGAFVVITLPIPSKPAASPAAKAGSSDAEGAPAPAASKSRRRSVTGLLHVSQVSQLHVKNISTVLELGQKLRCTILSLDDKGQPKLSTKTLEAVPGQMLTDPQAVYDNAIKTAKANRQKEKAEAKKRLELAESVIIGLEDFGEIEHTCKTEVHSNKESVECKPL